MFGLCIVSHATARRPGFIILAQNISYNAAKRASSFTKQISRRNDLPTKKSLTKYSQLRPILVTENDKTDLCYWESFNFYSSSRTFGIDTKQKQFCLTQFPKWCECYVEGKWCSDHQQQPLVCVYPVLRTLSRNYFHALESSTTTKKKTCLKENPVTSDGFSLV